MIYNIHLSLTNFKNETRVIKQTQSLIESKLIDKIHIIALHADGLEESSKLQQNIFLHRLRLKTRKLPKNFILQIPKIIEYIFYIMKLCTKKNKGIVTVHSLVLLPIGYFLKIFYKIKLVYDAHELETETYKLEGTRKKYTKY